MKIRFVLIVITAILFAVVLWKTVGLRNEPSGRESVRETKEEEQQEAKYALEAFRWYNDQRAFPSGHIPQDWHEKATSKIQEMNFKDNTRSVNAISWTSVGPTNIAGRMRSIAIDTLHHILYAGSVSGGIWKSTDAGGSWNPLTDLANNLVIGCLSLDPTNPNIIYAGTGEGYYNIDALRGIGVLKSTDGGGTWTVLNNFVGASLPVVFINKIVINPLNSNTIYAAVSAVDVGVWKSTDAGASWAKLSSAGGTVSGGSLKFCTDLVMDPTNPNVLYGSFGLFNSNGIWKTTNGGTSWANISKSPSVGFPSTSTKYTRISIAIAKTNPLRLYACLADSNYYTQSIQTSTDGGATWSAVATPFDSDPLVNGTHLGGQGWYNNVIAVDPTNETVVLTGGINMFRSTNSGTSWARISDGNAGGMHVDQHAIVYDLSAPTTVFAGNDGGVFKSLNAGVSFTAVNSGLTTAQFYSGSSDPTADIYFGGTQDNGTLKTSSSTTWNEVFSGDGGVTIVDPNTPTTIYTEYVYLAIQKSINSGVSFQRSINGIPTSGPNASNGTSDRCGFIAPFVLDPSNSQNLVAGTYRVFRSTDGANSWNAISGDLTGDGPGSTSSSGSVITALAIAKTSTQTIYAGTSGYDTLSSRIQVTTNTGTLWTNVTKSPLPNRYVSDIVIDQSNASRAIATFSGYNTNTPSSPGHVFRTVNRGVSWSDISGNLPDIPVNTVLLDSANANHMMIGTDLGVFESIDGGVTWLVQNTGMANVSVVDLDLRKDGYVLAATHGRGMFKSTIPFGVTSGVLSIIIHQNSILSKFVDFFITSAESLSTVPTLSVTVGANQPQSVPMTQNSYRVFKGSYQFTGSGILTLNSSAEDSSAHTVIGSRGFQVQLLKQDEGGTVQTESNDAALNVSPGALTEDTYVTVVQERSSMISDTVLGTPYTFGPAKEFAGAVSIQFAYTEEQLAGRDERHLTVLKNTGTAWVPVESEIDVPHKQVRANISQLGMFALGYLNQVVAPSLPQEYVLRQNYPNPFNPTTTISFSLVERGSVQLEIYDITGKKVTTLVDGERDAGNYSVVWSGQDGSGKQVASGVYFYRLSSQLNGATRFTGVGKMLMVR